MVITVGLAFAASFLVVAGEAMSRRRAGRQRAQQHSKVPTDPGKEEQ
jgi:hypothetical protein